MRSIAVIGPTGDDAMYVTGGSAGVPPAAGRGQPLAGITARAGPDVRSTPPRGRWGRSRCRDGRRLDRRGRRAAGAPTGATATSRAPRADARRPDRRPRRGARGGPGLWSARWTGTLTPTETGLHRFSLLHAGLGTRPIDGQLVAPGYREATQFIVGPRYPLLARGPTGRRQAGADPRSSTRAGQLFGAQIHFGWQPPSASGIPAAVAAARAAPTSAIVFANNAQGEGMDRSTLALPGDQDELIAPSPRRTRGRSSS